METWDSRSTKCYARVLPDYDREALPDSCSVDTISKVRF